MRKVFLTGPVQIGKSTVIDAALRRLGRTVGGIRTVRVEGPEGGRAFVLVDCMTGERFPLARWTGGRMDVRLETFETGGVRALQRAIGGADLIVLDELGWMEIEAPKFQRHVFAALDSPTRVLGVVRSRENPFLDAVRAHPRVEVLPVTLENRDGLVEVVVQRLETCP